MDAIDLRVWGSACLIGIALLGIAWLWLRVLRTASPLSVRLLVGAGFLLALLASGPAVLALVRVGLPADLRIVPGLVAQWAPAVLIACGSTIALTRSRQLRRS